jgi:hypothetical protein
MGLRRLHGIRNVAGRFLNFFVFRIYSDRSWDTPVGCLEGRGNPVKLVRQPNYIFNYRLLTSRFISSIILNKHQNVCKAHRGASKLWRQAIVASEGELPCPPKKLRIRISGMNPWNSNSSLDLLSFLIPNIIAHLLTLKPLITH